MTEKRASEILSVCALQFDGFRYAKLFPVVHGNALQPLERFVSVFAQAYQFFALPEENWAAFFMVRRMLSNAGEDFFSRRGPLQNMAGLLYLHLHHREVPTAFALQGNRERWQCVSRIERDECAAFVSRWLAEAEPGRKMG